VDVRDRGGGENARILESFADGPLERWCGRYKLALRKPDNFTKKLFHIQTIIDSATYDLFNKVKASNYCFYHLLPPHRPLHDALRVRGHQFQLLNCTYKFHKHYSFILSSLFRVLK